jgi:hypothetical protein
LHCGTSLVVPYQRLKARFFGRGLASPTLINGNNLSASRGVKIPGNKDHA